MKPAYTLAFIAPAIFLFSCQNQSPDRFDKLRRDLSDTASFSGLSGDSVKLVKTGDMNFKVKSVEQGIRAVSALAQKHRGMVYFQNFKSVEGGSKELKVSDDSLLVISTATPQANATVRVPSDHLETFLIEVSELGYFTESSQLQIDDKSLEYLANTLKQKNREKVLYKLKNDKADSLADVRTIAIGDETIEQVIANKTIDANASYSTVSLNLYQNAIVRKEMIANYVIDDYNLPFTARLSNALRNGWESFLNFIVAISHLWMFILCGMLLYVGYRLWQQRKRIMG